MIFTFFASHWRERSRSGEGFFLVRVWNWRLPLLKHDIGLSYLIIFCCACAFFSIQGGLFLFSRGLYRPSYWNGTMYCLEVLWGCLLEVCFSRKQSEITIARRIVYGFYFIKLRSDFSVLTDSSSWEQLGGWCGCCLCTVTDNRREVFWIRRGDN